MTRRIAVVTAGLSEQSTTRLLADRLAAATREAARAPGGRAASAASDQSRPLDLTVEVIEVRPLAHALADATLTGFASGDLAVAQKTVAEADGLIVVTPVFSASYSGLFKLFFDVLEPGSLDGMPVLVAATAGTARHSLVLEHALRPLFSHLRATVLPTAVFAATEDWGSEDRLAGRIERAAAELVAAVRPRPNETRGDQFDRDLAAMGSFEDLLRG